MGAVAMGVVAMSVLAVMYSMLLQNAAAEGACTSAVYVS